MPAFTDCNSGMNRSIAERIAERLWYRRSAWASLLLPFAGLIWIVVRARRALYVTGVLRSGTAGIPVIVVGNLTVGGTGKTPVVEWIARILKSQGFRPGIVSRGYGVAPDPANSRVDPAGSWRLWGDEPLMLARHAGVPVQIAGSDRCSAIRKLADSGVDVVVSDDGLQHYRMPRDFEIAVIDGVRGLGNGWLLPAGPLREPPSRLASVDLVLVNGGEGMPAGSAPVGHFTLEGSEACRPDGTERQPLAAFAGRQVWAVAGIGNPDRFGSHLSRYGVDPVMVRPGDHEVVDLGELVRIADRPVLMTEKDAVKYDDAMKFDAWMVPVSLSMSGELQASISKMLLAALRNRRSELSTAGFAK
jgi:tetraacyldisaccharide 4'-kinase